MDRYDRIYIGWDPGVTRSGVVVLDNNLDLIAGATFKADEAKYCHGVRVNDMSEEILGWLDDLSECEEIYDAEYILCVETPIMGAVRNVSGFALQWRTIQAGIDKLPWDTCVEVHNTTSKKNLTGSGNADKNAMVAACPFTEWGMFGDTEDNNKNVDALADAYAHALCGKLPVGTSGTQHYAHYRDDLCCHAGPVVELEV